MESQNEVTETSKVNECPEFPYFGASYPDATCIDGWLWDLDKFDNGQLYGGGEEPCPFCNTEAFIEQNENEHNTRESLLEYIEKLRARYGSPRK
jgi:chitinase